MNKPVSKPGGACGYGKIPFALTTMVAAALTAVALAVALGSVAQAAPEPLPAVITAGGTYAGTITNADNSKVAAVQIATSQPVIIENATISSTTDGIRVTANNADVVVRNSTLRQLHPKVSGRLAGYALLVPDVASAGRLVFEHNEIVGETATAPSNGGILIRGWTRGQDDEELKVRYNKMSNCNGMTSTSTGWSNTTKVSLQHRFFGHRDVHDVPGFEVAWNAVVNDYGSSSCEDHISAYNSGGNGANPHQVRDNLIDGAYPTGPSSSSYSGGGVITDGTSSATSDQTDQYIYMQGNVVIDSMNYGAKITQGHHNRLVDNIAVRDGYSSDGQYYLDDASLNTGSAIALNNAKGTSYFGAHTVTNDKAGHAGGTEFNVKACPSNAPCTVANNVAVAETQTNEQAVRQAYYDRASAAGITFGPTTEEPPPEEPLPPDTTASFEAESMSENISAIAQVQDAGAVPGARVNANRHTGVGSASKAAPNSQTGSELVVRARGVFADGYGPYLIVGMAGVEVHRARVPSSTYSDVVIEKSVPGGSAITIGGTGMEGTKRPLYVDRVTIR